MSRPRFPFTIVTPDNEEALAAMYGTPEVGPHDDRTTFVGTEETDEGWTVTVTASPPRAADYDDYSIHTPDDEMWDEDYADSLAKAKAAHPAGKGRDDNLREMYGVQVTKTVVNEATRLLDDAKATVTARDDVHGEERLLAPIADMWSAYLDTDIAPWDVANLMVLLKVARAKRNPQHRDSYLDIAGYAALGHESAEEYQ